MITSTHTLLYRSARRFTPARNHLRSIILEKTLHDGDHVLENARKFAEAGCDVHLLGTHITPLRNWAFLRARMLSGRASGRYITKGQAIASLRQYHHHFSRIVREPELRRIFSRHALIPLTRSTVRRLPSSHLRGHGRPLHSSLTLPPRSIHAYDVLAGDWCLSVPDTTVRFLDDPPLQP